MAEDSDDENIMTYSTDMNVKESFSLKILTFETTSGIETLVMK
jgi:hypothetical protein